MSETEGTTRALLSASPIKWFREEAFLSIGPLGISYSPRDIGLEVGSTEVISLNVRDGRLKVGGLTVMTASALKADAQGAFRFGKEYGNRLARAELGLPERSEQAPTHSARVFDFGAERARMHRL